MEQHVFADAAERLKGLLDEKMGLLERAAKARDIPVVRGLTADIGEIGEIIKHVDVLAMRLQRILDGGGGLPGDTPEPAQRGMREVVVDVTEGMIGQNYLSLARDVSAGRVRIGEFLNVRAHPSGDTFRTDIVEAGKKLRERGQVAKFFRDAGVRAGDQVVLTEMTPGYWALGKLERQRRAY